MLKRLLGLETEYAIRFSPEEGVEHPGNRLIYEALAEGIGRLVTTGAGERGEFTQQFFTENGGAFCYEALPQAMDGGLIEGATPECRGPRQLLLYQKAHDTLLTRAIPSAEKILEERGFPGTVGILKNCRDVEGNVYGAQENYEVRLCGAVGLWAWRLGMISLIPVISVSVVTMWGFLVAMVIFMMWIMVGMTVAAFANQKPNLPEDPIETWIPEAFLGRASYVLTLIIWWPAIVSMALLLRAVAFWPMRRGGEAFLVSRPVLTGCGILDEEGRFGLSEKGPSVRCKIRRGLSPDDRPIFDTGNLMKPVMMLFKLDLSGFKALMAARQRMQLGLSDSNVAQVAEYLKIGTTALVVDMAEAGFLKDAPRLRRPIEALHTIAADPTLQVEVEVKGGKMRALDIQRYYCDRARAFLDAAPARSIEAVEIVGFWEDALEALDTDPGSMVGRLDWVTKRYLIEAVAADEPIEVQRKVALRYHELGEGYLARLEEAGAAVVLVDADDVESAMTDPPSDTPAVWRSRLMREHAMNDEAVVVSWGSVRIGGALRGKVLKLSDYR